MEKSVQDWLLSGDVSIQYQVHKYLLGSDREILDALSAGICTEGWGCKMLSCQQENGHWGLGYYQPKWISTHYSLQDLKNLEMPREIPQVQKILNRLFEETIDIEGAVNYSSNSKADVCINGMILTIAAYFRIQDSKLHSVIDYLLYHQMEDGGWNCMDSKCARHSSLHTTLSVLEGFEEYRRTGESYRIEEIKQARDKGREFILCHRLYKSDKTGSIINKKFTMLSYPGRWFYDILRALVYFCSSGTPYDERMHDALLLLVKKRRKDLTWPLQANHPGKVHFDMEKTRSPSRWNTLRALRVLNCYADYI